MNTSAIICPIKDETRYISKFLEYYSHHFDSKDIYILNFGSDQDYLDQYIGDNAQIINTDVDILDAYATFKEIRKNIQSLKKQHDYDFVLPLDVDELVIYNQPGGLKEYLKNLKKDFVTCRGYEVVHIPGLQDSFDYSKPWSDQIEYWYPDAHHYNKTLISRHDLDWRIGFHLFYLNGEKVDRKKYVDDDLFLIHLHKHDFESTINRHFEISQMKWSENTIKEGYNSHYRTQDIKKIKEWYFESILENKIYKIPEDIRKNIRI